MPDAKTTVGLTHSKKVMPVRNLAEWEDNLAVPEVKQFLTWLFSDLAGKTKPLGLRETVSVARYLMDLAALGVPKKTYEQGPQAIEEYRWGSKNKEIDKARDAVRNTARVLLQDLAQFSRVRPAKKTKTQSFFREHAANWGHPWIKRALRFVAECEMPESASNKPRLLGRHLSQEGGNAYLDDDLSERIAAADAALTRAGVKGVSARIAKSLCKSGLTKGRLKRCEGWGAEEVRVRINAYRRQKAPISAEHAATKWICAYREALRVKGENRERLLASRSKRTTGRPLIR